AQCSGALACLHDTLLLLIAGRISDKAVCELGAGVGLAGLCIARYLDCTRVLITDGNETVVASMPSISHNRLTRPPDISVNVAAIAETTPNSAVACLHLPWNQPPPGQEHQAFDVVIAADWYMCALIVQPLMVVSASSWRRITATSSTQR